MDKDLVKAALIRAIHAFWQALASVLPIGVVITPTMLKEADWSIALVVLAWLATALLAGVISFAKSMAVGVPEVALAKTLYDLDNDGEVNPKNFITEEGDDE